MNKSFNYAKIFFLVLITTLGTIGIFTAPSKNSDSEKLQKELDNNKSFLMEQSTKKTANSTIELANELKNTPHVQVTIIGDSIVLGASQSLSNTIPNCFIDAGKSRQVSDAISILESLEGNGNLRDTVILSLGTNGYFREETGQAIIDYIGSERTIYWINVYGKHLQSSDATNKVIASLISCNDNLHLIDWASEGADHPDWFYSDGIHLNERGQEGFSQFVFENIQ